MAGHLQVHSIIGGSHGSFCAQSSGLEFLELLALRPLKCSIQSSIPSVKWLALQFIALPLKVFLGNDVGSSAARLGPWAT